MDEEGFFEALPGDLIGAWEDVGSFGGNDFGRIGGRNFLNGAVGNGVRIGCVRKQRCAEEAEKNLCYVHGFFREKFWGGSGGVREKYKMKRWEGECEFF